VLKAGLCLMFGVGVALVVMQSLGIMPGHLAAEGSPATLLLGVAGICFAAGFAFAMLSVIRRTFLLETCRKIPDDDDQAAAQSRETDDDTVFAIDAIPKAFSDAQLFQKSTHMEPIELALPESESGLIETAGKCQSIEKRMTDNPPNRRQINNQEIPVENLVRGVTNALGAGLETIIDTSVSGGNELIKRSRNGCSVAVTTTIYGFGRILGIVDGNTRLERNKSKNAN
jgi:hypothetical protein